MNGIAFTRGEAMGFVQENRLALTITEGLWLLSVLATAAK